MSSPSDGTTAFEHATGQEQPIATRHDGLGGSVQEVRAAFRVGQDHRHGEPRHRGLRRIGAQLRLAKLGVELGGAQEMRRDPLEPGHGVGVPLQRRA